MFKLRPMLWQKYPDPGDALLLDRQAHVPLPHTLIPLQAMAQVFFSRCSRRSRPPVLPTRAKRPVILCKPQQDNLRLNHLLLVPHRPHQIMPVLGQDPSHLPFPCPPVQAHQRYLLPKWSLSILHQNFLQLGPQTPLLPIGLLMSHDNVSKTGVNRERLNRVRALQDRKRLLPHVRICHCQPNPTYKRWLHQL